MKLFYILLLFSAFSQILFSQKPFRVAKSHIGFSGDVGVTFPHFDINQERWEATTYLSGSATFWYNYRLNRTWELESGLGLTAYSLDHKNRVDRYTLDFASPHLLLGIGYHIFNQFGQDNFLKFLLGSQMGFQGQFTDEFDTYSIAVKGEQPFYYFIRTELGIRRFFKKKSRKSTPRITYDLGCFFRYNFSRLGSAQIRESDFQLSILPKGDIVGMYFKLLLPVGKKRIMVDREKPKELPPVIIHNIRYWK